MIEVVRNSQTTSNINIELGGLRAVTNNRSLSKWLKRYEFLTLTDHILTFCSYNSSEEAYEAAVENFMASCAGYCVITYILGFADRHNDNIMLTRDGRLFHIDFGHFLGHYRKLFGGIWADKVEFVFLEQYYGVIGKKNYPRFVQLCQVRFA